MAALDGRLFGEDPDHGAYWAVVDDVLQQTDRAGIPEIARQMSMNHGTAQERLAAVLSAWRDFTGKPLEERDQDEPSGELQIEEICDKHGFDLDTFIADISYYGLFHLACPNCGSISLCQVQYDRVEEAECRHRIKYAYLVMPSKGVAIEYIPDEIGPDEDPPQVAIECRDCHTRCAGGELVIASQAYADGYPEDVIAPTHGPDAEAAVVEQLTPSAFLQQLEDVRKRALELRDAVGATRKAAPRRVADWRDEPDLDRLLWFVEEHLDEAAGEAGELLEMLDS